MEKVRLDSVFNLQMGKTPARNNDTYWNNGENKWVSISDLSNCGKYIETTKETISNKAVKDSGIKLTPQNTVIMSFKLSVGKTAITKEPIYTNEAIMAFIPKKENQICPDYFYYYLAGYNWEKGTNRAVMGLTLNKATLSAMKIKLPTLKVQRNVVNKLDLLKTIITEKKEQLAQLDLLIKARFVEMFGTLKENPFNFNKVAMSLCCNKITDGKHGGCEVQNSSGFYFVGAREIYDGIIHYASAPQITESDFKQDYKRCNAEKGDFVIVNTGATIGKSAILSDLKTENTLFQKSVALIKVKPDLLNVIFLKYCYMINTDMYIVKSASAQPNLLLSMIKNTNIYLPPMELQNHFASFVQQIDKSKLAVQKSLDEAQLLYDSLMQKYFN